ncbi:MAG TPA: selenocysteine-specific translation elongation factor [bacterium]
MRHFVIGTAGHIDHGKSALVKALTGTDPDRLEEEQRRGMTIDLGFAHFDLPSGRRVGIVDVPGHERLIKNMLAGATGIDLVMLVVAADEGVMPQTREHLDILRFLPVQRGIVILNKIDLVTDPAWLALVIDDLAALTAATFLEGMPVLRVSARTGEGLGGLIEAIDRLLDGVPAHAVDAPARLPVDRAFTMTGFGTVVTGTLWSGRIRKDSELELLPQGRPVRVRGLQSHGTNLDEVTAGSRVAVNVVGADKTEITRGQVLATAGAFRPSTRIDARFRLLPAAPPLAHLARIRMYIGADEIFGRIVLLDRTRLDPGGSAVGQLRLERPAVVAAGDPFVLRRYSPMTTVGGGTVINPHPPLRRRTAGSVSAIEEVAAAPDARVDGLVAEGGVGGTTLDDLARDVGESRTHVEAIVRQLAEAGRVRPVRDRFFHRETAGRLSAAILAELDANHRKQPWRAGMPRDELKAKVFPSGDDRFYASVVDELTRGDEIATHGALVARAGHRPEHRPPEVAARTALAAALAAGATSPPSRDDLQRAIGDAKLFARMFQTLIDDGTVVEAGPGVYFHRDALEAIRQTVAAYVASHGSITVAALRDVLKTSRKFALTVLEYFDTIKFTRRVGDARVLVKARES